jgi:predicted dehydrogenase/threonine dehydrogenase-like Zn-dependent dehydrogenase
MKQLIQHLKSGKIELIDVPSASVSSGSLLIETSATLISAGTERMLNSFARGGYITKARQQPEKVKQVLEKALSDGILSTYQAVSKRLEQPIPLGYSNVGRVLAVGADVKGFEVGDRVVSNGPHSEVVHIPENLVAKVPDELSDEEATFTVVSAIGLQGIRLIKPELGETVCVAGLGLIGLLAVQMLVANGCRVFGFDTNAERVAMAKEFGAEALQIGDGVDLVSSAIKFSGGQGVDAVLITASTTNNELISQCAKMTRQRGRIVLTGVVGLNLNRADFYDKEISFQVSCSYGPGRYQPAYEEQGLDYPLGYVRWTENRNFLAALELMRSGSIKTSSLVTGSFEFEKAAKAYDALSASDQIGIIMKYSTDKNAEKTKRSISTPLPEQPASPSSGRIGMIGAGNFAQITLLPALIKSDATLSAIVSSTGTSAAIAAKQFNIENVTTDTDAILSNPNIDAVMITTRHNSHTGLVKAGLKAGKHIFVEKPLCLTEEELDEISALKRSPDHAGQIVMVGFNRRFSPMVQEMKRHLDKRNSPAFLVLNCNAGHIPSDHWTQDPDVGGGRIIGEACHFIDLASHLCDEKIHSVSALSIPTSDAGSDDNYSISLQMVDGSVAQVNYFAVGSKSFPKEEFTANWEGKSITLTNFLRLKGYGVSASKRALSQDKGHLEQCKQFVKAIKNGGDAPISYDSVDNVTRATLLAVRSAKDGKMYELE